MFNTHKYISVTKTQNRRNLWFTPPIQYYTENMWAISGHSGQLKAVCFDWVVGICGDVERYIHKWPHSLLAFNSTHTLIHSVANVVSQTAFPEAYHFLWNHWRSLSISRMTPLGPQATLCYSCGPLHSYICPSPPPQTPDNTYAHLCKWIQGLVHMQTYRRYSHTMKFIGFAVAICMVLSRMSLFESKVKYHVFHIWLSQHKALKISLFQQTSHGTGDLSGRNMPAAYLLHYMTF